MSQTKAQLLDNIKDNVQLDARNSLRFADTDSSHYVAFKAPATVSSNVTWTLPAADGSANYVLATDGSGTLSWIADPAGQWVTSGSNIYFTAGNVGIGDSSPSNPLSVTGASSFNGDVTFTGASYNVTWDKSADDLIFNDNAQIAFGTGSDFKIYHNGTHNYFMPTTGDIIIDNGSGELARITQGGDIELPDNGEFRAGTGDDLKIYHDGTNSFISNSTGILHLRSDNGIRLQDSGGVETFVKCVDNGAVELYYDNVKTVETEANGIIVKGPEGGDGILRILADEGDDNADFWRLFSSSASSEFRIQNANNGSSWENNIKCFGDGAVELYHDNAKKLETSEAGIGVTDLDDNSVEVRLTTAQGLAGYLYANTAASPSGSLGLYTTASEPAIQTYNNGAVELYYDNNKKLNTQQYGVDIENNLYIKGTEGTSASLYLMADESDDNADAWRINSNQDDNDLTFANNRSGSYVDILTLSNAASTTHNLFLWGQGITDGNEAMITIKGTTTGGTDRHSQLMVAKHSNITNLASAMRWQSDDGTTRYLYMDDSVNVRLSGNYTDIGTTNGTIVGSQGSDIRLKNLVGDGSVPYGLAEIKQLNPIRFKYKKIGGDPNRIRIGFSAQQVQPIIPESVYNTGEVIDEEENILAMDYVNIIPALVNAVKELSTEVETLKTKVSALESA